MKIAGLREINGSPFQRVAEIRPALQRCVPILQPHTRNPGKHVIQAVMLWFSTMILGALTMIFLGTVAVVVFAIAMTGFIIWWVRSTMSGPLDLESRGHYVRAMTRASLCPTCLYDLCGARPDDEGVVTCSECGSAWRAKRLERIEAIVVPEIDETEAPRHWFDAWVGNMSRKSTRDEAGQWVALADPRALAVKRSLREAGRLARVRRATRRSRAQGRWKRVFLVLVSTPAYLVLLASVPGRYFSTLTNPVDILFGICILFSCCAGIALIWNLITGRVAVKPERIVRDALDEDLCPACWADLAGVENEPDPGKIVCPACGACWSVLARDSARGISS